MLPTKLNLVEFSFLTPFQLHFANTVNPSIHRSKCYFKSQRPCDPCIWFRELNHPSLVKIMASRHFNTNSLSESKSISCMDPCVQTLVKFIYIYTYIYVYIYVQWFSQKIILLRERSFPSGKSTNTYILYICLKPVLARVSWINFLPLNLSGDYQAFKKITDYWDGYDMLYEQTKHCTKLLQNVLFL